jgi:hypothetical protein
VFINCVFGDKYRDLFHAVIFAIHACGYRARSARDLDDGGQTRIDKLCSLIETCRYGIHDLSRTELDRTNRLPRFNMPLELGIFLGAKRFGGPAKRQTADTLGPVKPADGVNRRRPFGSLRPVYTRARKWGIRRTGESQRLLRVSTRSAVPLPPQNELFVALFSVGNRFSQA